jgi:hypothetical protein
MTDLMCPSLVNVVSLDAYRAKKWRLKVQSLILPPVVQPDIHFAQSLVPSCYGDYQYTKDCDRCPYQRECFAEGAGA